VDNWIGRARSEAGICGAGGDEIPMRDEPHGIESIMPWLKSAL